MIVYDNDHQVVSALIAAAVSADDHTLAWWYASTALALAGAAELPVLIEEAEGALGRIEHDASCSRCREGAIGAPAVSYWCVR